MAKFKGKGVIKNLKKSLRLKADSMYGEDRNAFSKMAFFYIF
ncbi:UNVERIFIED_ORG: hypothetical protein ABRZ91_003339 [Heyndrickxia coagulans]